jgi:hypothetical protein
MKPKVGPAMIILRIFCAMVFLSIGFGHRMPVAIASQAQSAVYMLPDGSYADLCIADHAHKSGTPPAGCEACRLAGAVILPEPSDQSWLLSCFARLAMVVPAEETIGSHHLLDRPRLRGPPVVV